MPKAVVMYYTLAHFRWKPHIFQKNGFSIKKWKTIYFQFYG